MGKAGLSPLMMVSDFVSEFEPCLAWKYCQACFVVSKSFSDLIKLDLRVSPIKCLASKSKKAVEEFEHLVRIEDLELGCLTVVIPKI